MTSTGPTGGTTSGLAYLPLDVRRLEPGEQVPFDLFVLTDKRYVLYRAATLPLSVKDLDDLKRRGHERFYVDASARKHMARYFETRLAKELRSEERSTEEKAEFLVEASRVIMEDVFENLEEPSTLEGVRLLAEQTVDFVATGRRAFRRLVRLVSHDYYTYTHSLHVGIYTIALGRQLGLSAEFQRKLGEGALFHDIGKALVPPEILTKPMPLTPDEWQVMKQHPQLGIDLLGAHGQVDEVTRWAILGHHERMDGRGYPFGLSGEEIALPGRIVALADVYDALTTNRPYQSAQKSFDALNVIKDHMLTGIDRDLFRELVVLLARDGDLW